MSKPTFLSAASYGLRLREIQKELGQDATPEAAVAELQSREIYKDTAENRAKYGAEEKK